MFLKRLHEMKDAHFGSSPKFSFIVLVVVPDVLIRDVRFTR